MPEIDIPPGFEATTSADAHEVRCVRCDALCTVGVAYGEPAEDHDCDPTARDYGATCETRQSY